MQDELSETRDIGKTKDEKRQKNQGRMRTESRKPNMAEGTVERGR